MPTIVLGQDEVDCFAAWVSAEAGLPDQVEVGSDIKVSVLTNEQFMPRIYQSFISADKLWQSIAASAVGTLVAHAHPFNGRRGHQRQ